MANIPFSYKIGTYYLYFLLIALSIHAKKIKRPTSKEVFKVVSILELPKNIRIFSSQFMDEIKNIRIANAFEKSRLVV